MRTVIVSDCHGNYEELKASLTIAGVINEDGNRMTDADNRCYVIQIGDLANCCGKKEENDLKCLQEVGNWIDVMLMGNHEITYFDQKNLFSGFSWDQRISDELERIFAEGKLKPAALCGEILVSHAGWDKDNHPYIDNAKDAYDYIMDQYNREGWWSRLFSQIGYSRGGNSKHGGILWEDFNDLRSPFPQIVGHTARKRIRLKKNAICIDAGHTYRPTVIEV
jgi:hypothetical protein